MATTITISGNSVEMPDAVRPEMTPLGKVLFCITRGGGIRTVLTQGSIGKKQNLLKLAWDYISNTEIDALKSFYINNEGTAGTITLTLTTTRVADTLNCILQSNGLNW